MFILFHVFEFTILICTAATSLVDPAPARLQEWTKASIDLLPSQIFVPRSHASDLRPVIVFLHGGGDGPYDVMNRQSLPSLLLNVGVQVATHDYT